MSALWRTEDGGEAARVHASGASTEGADEDCRSAQDRSGQVTGRSRDRSYRQTGTTAPDNHQPVHNGRHRAATANDFH